MQRRPTHELLDTDSGTPREVADSLLDLRWFNRWFGGLATVRDMVHTVLQRTGASQLSLLEVAAGEGYILNTIREEFAATGVDLDVTLLDRVHAHLPANGLFSKVAGDALSLPFAGGTFDIVSCSLFVHHLAPEQAVLFAKEALRVCSVAVLIHDLIRSPLHLALAYAGVPLYRSRLTRNDAPASVRQAYTVEEMEGFLHAAGAEKIDAQKHYFYRMGVIAWKGSERPK
jgi:ubiquinone/menaquinone biosynthesis C-methylase UbiE